MTIDIKVDNTLKLFEETREHKRMELTNPSVKKISEEGKVISYVSTIVFMLLCIIDT